MPRNHAEFLDAALTKPSLEVLSDLENAYFSGDRLLVADKIGDIDARRHAQAGDTIDGIDTWIPGRDKVTNLDVQKSLESGEPRTKTRTEPSSPNVLHVALDLPPRLDTVEGKYLVKNIGLFALSVTSVIARETQANLQVYVNDGSRADVVFDDPNIDNLWQTYDYIQSDGTGNFTPVTPEEPSLNGLLRVVDSHIDYDDDGLVVVSDFQDGFDGSGFDWDQQYRGLQMALGGRLRPVQIETPSHMRPNAAHNGLPPAVLAQIGEEYREIYYTKQQLITDILGMHALRFSTSESLTEDGVRPSELLSDYIAHGNL